MPVPASIIYVTKFDVSLQTVDDRRYISGRLVVTALVVMFILSCAKINSPSGGPKDLDAPVILKSQPENGTVMFSGKSFAVTFNEFVILDKITEKFMASPPLKTKPEVRLKGKSLVVSWEDTLADSTTYTFYFQDAIRDNNENNAIPNYQYVFSTGPVLDSLSLSGNVFGAFDLEVVPDVLVMMYSNLSDTASRTLLPAYISRPDVSGGFMINNIKPGRFRLYALKDINGNKMYDLEDEAFAFCDSIIDITPEAYYNIIPDTIKYKPANAPEKAQEDIFTFGVHRLYAFTREAKKQYLRFSERKNSGSISFGLAVPSDTGQVSIDLTDIAPDTWYMENNARRDTFLLWITSPEVYDREVINALITYPFTDSTGTLIEKTDSVVFRFRKPEAPRGGVRKIPALSLTTNLSGKIKPGAIPAFTGPAPLKEPDTSKITLMQIVDTIRTELPVVLVRDSTNSRRVLMKTPLKAGGSYTLECRGGAFTDIFGNTTDSTVYRIAVGVPEDYGTIKAKLTGYEGDVIIQLLGDREKVLQEKNLKSPGEVKFELIDKGRYRMRAVYDIDSSRTWTTGDFALMRNPEPVSYYPGELDVKINWDLEQDWDLGVMYSKDVSLRTKPAAKR
jgi:uncharacterized protein (DUF2141 family)